VIVCMFEHIQWRWAMTYLVTTKMTDPPAASVALTSVSPLKTTVRLSFGAMYLAAGREVNLTHPCILLYTTSLRKYTGRRVNELTARHGAMYLAVGREVIITHPCILHITNH
jgi:hypothetical protein